MRFSNTVAIFCSATATTALALPQAVPVAVPVAVPAIGLNGNDILQTLGLASLDNELIKLNASITGLNAANLQSQTGGPLNGIKNILSPFGLGGTVNSVLNSVVGPILSGLSSTGGVQNAYANVLAQLNNLNTNGGTLTPDQATQVTNFLSQYQLHLQQLLVLLQTKLGDFNALSSGSLSSDPQNTLNSLLGGVNTGNAVDRVRAFIQQTNINNANLLSGVTSLVSRVAPNLQATLQTVTSLLQNLVNVTIRVYTN